MKYTTLLFDADGTLLDFDATEKRALQKVFDLHGLSTEYCYEKAVSANQSGIMVCV